MTAPDRHTPTPGSPALTIPDGLPAPIRVQLPRIRLDFSAAGLLADIARDMGAALAALAPSLRAMIIRGSGRMATLLGDHGHLTPRQRRRLAPKPTAADRRRRRAARRHTARVVRQARRARR